MSKKTKIGNFVWVLPYVIFTNDPTPPSEHLDGVIVEDFVSICASATIMPGVILEERSLVCASACVTKDVPANMAVAGVPARIKCETKEILMRDGSGESAYPWTKHFHRGYPEVITKKWS